MHKSCYISISPDFDRWCIHINQDNELDVYYLGSVSGQHLEEALQEYFADRLPGK